MPCVAHEPDLCAEYQKCHCEVFCLSQRHLSSACLSDDMAAMTSKLMGLVLFSFSLSGKHTSCRYLRSRHHVDFRLAPPA